MIQLQTSTSPVRVLFTEPEAYPAELRQLVPEHWNCTYRTFGRSEELLRWMGSADSQIVFARIGLSFDKRFFESSEGLRLLVTPTTGLDHIDLEAAEQCGVEVLSLRGQFRFLEQITSTAEHAWSLLLACNRLLPALISKTKRGNWTRSDLELHQISSQTLGVIGMGRLGLIIAQYGVAFRMKVLGYDPKKLQLNDEKIELVTDLEKLLELSDHIIVAASYSVGDPVILGTREIDKMKPGVCLVNIARGELVDERAVIEGLDNGTIRTVGVDVLAGDSKWTSRQTVSSPLLDRAKSHGDVVVTPHVGGYAREAVIATRRYMLQRAMDWVLHALRKEN